MSLRVLFTNYQMAGRGGTEMWIRDVAEALFERGHRPVVWSPVLGESATALRARGVPVIDDLDRLAEPPDLVHGHHLIETAAALSHFPGVPALFVCHGWLPWQERPPRLPRVRRYLAVDRLRRERLVSESGIPPDQVEILPNFVDLRRFPAGPSRPPRALRSLRALLLSNQTDAPGLMAAVRSACRLLGLAPPQVVGAATGNATDTPERVLAGADLVFARGRTALEAMAVGAAVVLCDAEGSGPLVTRANFDPLAELNFGVGALRGPLTGEALAAEMGRYDGAETAAVSRHVRESCSLDGAVERLLAIYGEILAESRLAPGDTPAVPAVEEGRAVARLLTEISRTLRERGELNETDWGQRIRELERELASLQTTSAFRLRASLIRSPLLQALVAPALRLLRSGRERSSPDAPGGETGPPR